MRHWILGRCFFDCVFYSCNTRNGDNIGYGGSFEPFRKLSVKLIDFRD